MSRTRKGSKPPGWEPWSNRHEKAQQKADFRDTEVHWTEDECRGCRLCMCVKCGGRMGATFERYTSDPDCDVYCISCGHTEEISLTVPTNADTVVP